MAAEALYRWLFIGALALAVLAVAEYLVEMAVRAWLNVRRAEREMKAWRERYDKR